MDALLARVLLRHCEGQISKRRRPERVFAEVYSDLYPSIERYSGAMSLTVLKQHLSRECELLDTDSI